MSQNPNYCLFFKAGRLTFGLIKDLQKNKWVVQPEVGKEIHLPKGQTALTWIGTAYGNDAEGLAVLAREIPKVEALALNLDLVVFHELLEKSRPYGLEELAELALSEPYSGWQQAALLMALKEQPVLFHQKKSEYFARSPEEIETLLAKEAREAQTKALEDLEATWAQSLRQGQRPQIDPAQAEPWRRFLSRLRQFVLYLDDHQEKEHFAKLFDLSPRGGVYAERPLLEALNLAGEKLSWGALQIEREGVKGTFSPEEMAAAAQLAQSDPWANDFGLPTEDLRSLGGVSVDNRETKDFDDALSFRLEEDRLLLWLHIAEVASYVTPTHPLFLTAQDRCSSLYSPLAVFPMLPPELSERFCSLNAGADKAAVTFFFEVDREGNLLSRRIGRSVIRLEANWSYPELDQKLEAGEEPWGRIEDFCLTLRNRRLEQGALELDREEVRLILTDLNHLQLDPQRRETRAHRLIQELAILVNAEAARVCQEAGRPNLFRNQEPYSLQRELPAGQKPKLTDLIIRPAVVELTPKGHSALGLPAYLQTSSPIRRFLDLVSQRLLLDLLANRPASFPPEALAKFAQDSEAQVRRLGQLERRLWEHLKIKYLGQNKDELYQATLVRELRGGRSVLHLPLLDLRLDAKMEGLEEGVLYEVRIRNINPQLDEVELELPEAVEPIPATPDL